jgi:hypothetical protein
MKVVPLTRGRANEVIAQWHRHNKPVVGCRFAIGAEHAGELVGVAVVGRPVARMVDFQKVAEVTRLCVVDGAPKNTCSFLYAACRRVWHAMGGERMITYTLTRETGASLRAAGWIPTPVQRKGETGWLSRDREHQAVFDEEKLRWEAPAAL